MTAFFKLNSMRPYTTEIAQYLYRKYKKAEGTINISKDLIKWIDNSKYIFDRRYRQDLTKVKSWLEKRNGLYLIINNKEDYGGTAPYMHNNGIIFRIDVEVSLNKGRFQDLDTLQHEMFHALEMITSSKGRGRPYLVAKSSESPKRHATYITELEQFMNSFISSEMKHPHTYDSVSELFDAIFGYEYEHLFNKNGTPDMRLKHVGEYVYKYLKRVHYPSKYRAMLNFSMNDIRNFKITKS